MKEKILSKIPKIIYSLGIISFVYGVILGISNNQGRLLADNFPLESECKIILFMAFIPVVAIILGIITWTLWGEEPSENENIELTLSDSWRPK